MSNNIAVEVFAVRENLSGLYLTTKGEPSDFGTRTKLYNSKLDAQWVADEYLDAEIVKVRLEVL